MEEPNNENEGLGMNDDLENDDDAVDDEVDTKKKGKFEDPDLESLDDLADDEEDEDELDYGDDDEEVM